MTFPLFPLFHPIFVSRARRMVAKDDGKYDRCAATSFDLLQPALPAICVLHASRLSRQIWKFERLWTPTDQSRTQSESKLRGRVERGNFAGENIIEVRE